MISANQAIFTMLDDFCALRGVDLRNRSAPRWIASLPEERDFIISSTVRDIVRFSAMRGIARFEYKDRVLFCSVGFEAAPPPDGANDVEVQAGHLTVILAELKPRPIASVSEIRDIVEASDRDADSDYSGHDFELVAELFPGVQLFEFRDAKPATWNVFFLMCIGECELAESWIEGELIKALRSLAERGSDRIPYAVLCRSIFDGDPTSFFLALYRCLESLYWFGSARDIRTALSISTDWTEIASVLEDALGWYPREEQSLAKLLELARGVNVTNVLSALGTTPEADMKEAAVGQLAAKRIYSLRNMIVHFRPAQQRVSLGQFDWVEICSAMTDIVIDVYDAIFPIESPRLEASSS